MPQAMIYKEPNDKTRDNYTIANPGTERGERAIKYKKSRDYYEGKQKRPLDLKDGEPDDNTIINMVAMTIDRMITFLFPEMPKLELSPTELEETEQEKWLRLAWEENGGVSLLQEITENGSLSGHCYVRIIPPNPDSGLDYPQILNLEPSRVITYWRADNVKQVLWHEIFWSVDTDDYLLDVINKGTSWELIQYARSKGGSWSEMSREEWPHKIGPIVDWQHLPNPNRYYGRGDTDHLALNDRLNRVTSELVRINRYHSSPKTVGTGVSAGEIQETSIDGLWTVENPDATIFNLEMRSEQQFAYNLMQFLYDTYLAQNRVVLLRGEVKDFQRVTNAGVRTVFMDMLSKNSVLRNNYGNAIRRISRVLSLVSGKGEFDPTVIHRDPLPIDDMEQVTIASMERAMGIASRQTISEKRGYMWTEEVQRQTAENELEIFSTQPPASEETTPLTNTAQDV